MKSVMVICVLVISVAFTFKRSENSHNNSGVGYKLSQPEEIYYLPRQLHEISGLTDISTHELGCIQDETGTIYIYDLLKKEVTKEIPVFEEGDYEGITLVGNDIYMLRSDGTLAEVNGYNSRDKKIRTYPLVLKTTNNEGLCYDEKGNRLLIAAKSKIGKGQSLKDIRVIYAFDLKTKTLLSEPILTFSVDDLKSYAKKHNITLPEKVKKQGNGSVSALRFMPSSLAVHPVTDHIYILSAIDRIFLVIDKASNILHLEQLNSELFIKPEGITFTRNGDMYISNEGEDKEATLLKFTSQ